MKHIFVYNPTAGRSNRAVIEQLKEKMAADYADLDYEFYPTKAPGDASIYVRTRCEEEPDTVFRFYACGGDGTANEVLHGLIGHENASMTCYPCGSGNDFVKYYGGADKFLDVDALIAATEEPIDVMKIGDRYALNVTNFGFDTTVARTMIKVKNKKVIGGKHAYTTGVMNALLHAMKNECTVWVDGECLNESGKCLLCTVANGSFVGGSFNCAPYSRDNDGLLEVCLVKPISRFTFIKLIGVYTAGNHMEDKRFKKIITYRRGRSIHVTAPEGFAFSLDGEIVEMNDFTIEVCPGAIRFAVPAGATPNTREFPVPETTSEEASREPADEEPADEATETPEGTEEPAKEPAGV